MFPYVYSDYAMTVPIQRHWCQCPYCHAWYHPATYPPNDPYGYPPPVQTNNFFTNPRRLLLLILLIIVLFWFIGGVRF